MTSSGLSLAPLGRKNRITILSWFHLVSAVIFGLGNKNTEKLKVKQMCVILSFKLKKISNSKAPIYGMNFIHYFFHSYLFPTWDLYGKTGNYRNICYFSSFCFYLRIKSLFFNLHDVMKTVGEAKIP